MPNRSLVSALALAATLVAAPAAVAQSAVPTVRDFAGRWEAASDDGTEQEVVELQASGNRLQGTLTALERGYYSGRTTVKAQVQLVGTLRGDVVELQVGDGSGATAPGTARLRGEYLVLAAGGQESGYARPGRPLVTSAEGSAEAARLTRAIAGRVYSAGGSAGNREGAIVGGRVRVALCADGGIAFDASDVGGTPGPGVAPDVSLGGTVTRRGTWEVVMRAGTPVVRARWEGTGSTYALTAYFAVEPSADGRSATIDGMRLPVTGRC